ncbi:RNA-directed DNA polymerase [Candidatus Saccharibacteria bacterium]|nr:MAG: RNA-directed DNA polymerase [Candidatus Saccharibacteria bacterium]
MPIGNLTSQIFANIYLNEFDRYVRHTLKPRGYVRYGDDFVLFVDDETEAQKVQIVASKWLE